MNDPAKTDMALRHWDEEQRLAALRRYDVFERELDGSFRDLVRIAAQICSAPIARITFVEESHEWFAAEVGDMMPMMPREASICARAISGPGQFVVPDLSMDRRFENNPLVTGEPYVRFYAGALLETEEGLPIGTICILDYKPRMEGLNSPQSTTLEALARQIMALLELRRALLQHDRAEAEKDAMIERLNDILATKDVLVQEVHHRVKNSLAMVQALLTLQARATADDGAAQQLRESAGRVRTIGSMHEHLYRMSAVAHVDISGYLRKLVTDQQSALLADGRTLSFEGDEAMWPSSEAPALGLVLTELITNAIKYGSGSILVTLKHQGEEAVLLVEDEGTALPDDFEPSDSEGFGMRIITGLLRGHGGHLEVDRSRNSTCFVATMKIPPSPIDS